VLDAVITAIQIFTRDGNRAYSVLYQHPDFIVIKTKSNKTCLIFYGTDSFEEWIDNLRFGLVSKESFPRGWYLSALLAQSLVGHLKPDYVIGYSRGAAIALIYSYLYDVQAIGFSSPNISKRLLYWKYRPVLIRSLNDIVSLVPLGYRLPGNYLAIYIENGGHSWYKNKFTMTVLKHLKKAE
jgi:hypothetical protein